MASDWPPIEDVVRAIRALPETEQAEAIRRSGRESELIIWVRAEGLAEKIRTARPPPSPTGPP